ncbi:CrcB family protein [Glaciihabitans sp. UYNi722]|uniref:fluoride efflux transporter FluC n=1 Tax=Glaciihabitans sp. UYNi722 TaxID=3156344 RepID=UPI003392C917
MGTSLVTGPAEENTVKSTPTDAELPIDSDLDVDSTYTGRPRPIHLRWRYLGLVAVGGMIGTAVREALSLVIPSIAGIPVATFAINIVGAFALGALLETLARRGPDEGRRRKIRLLVGTGVLGGFTTYSSLATDSILLTDGHGWRGALYALGTLVLGALATFAGIAIAASAHRSRQAADEVVE